MNPELLIRPLEVPDNNWQPISERSAELPLGPSEAAEDPWQLAFDGIFENVLSDPVLAEQMAVTVPLRQIVANFLKIAENLIGFEQAQRYANEMCTNHPHLQEGAQDYLSGPEALGYNDKKRKHKHSDKPECQTDKLDKRKRFKRASRWIGLWATLFSKADTKIIMSRNQA